jgi:hypothetical protein
MSTIAAGTTSGTALVSTGNTDGTIQLQVNGTTPSVTLATTGAIGVGSTPGYGTSGQALISGGSAAAPAWTTLGASAMTFITSVTASNSATVDLEDAMTTYDTYCVIASGVVPVTTSRMNLRLKISGAYVTTGTYNSQFGYSSISAFIADVSNAATSASLIRNNIFSATDNSANNAFFTMYINTPSNTTKVKPIFGTFSSVDVGSTVATYQLLTCYNTGTGAITGLRFSMATGNISTGTFRLYGISNS